MRPPPYKQEKTQLGNWTQTQKYWLVVWPFFFFSFPRLRCSVAKTPLALQLSVCPSLLICCLSAGHTLILWRGLGPVVPRKGFTELVSQGPIKTSFLLQCSYVAIVQCEAKKKEKKKGWFRVERIHDVHYKQTEKKIFNIERKGQHSFLVFKCHCLQPYFHYSSFMSDETCLMCCLSTCHLLFSTFSSGEINISPEWNCECSLGLNRV